MLLTEEVQAATTLGMVRRSDMKLLQICAPTLPATIQLENLELLRVKAHSRTQVWLAAVIQTSWQQLPFPLRRKAPVLDLITSPFIQ